MKTISQNALVRNKLNILSISVSVAISTMIASSAAVSQEPSVEEVVVTGTFIRRTEGFATASPVTQITAEDVANEGTANMGEIVKNSVFNLGTGTNNGIQGTTDTTSSFNLRGLGPNATLVLMDGIRTPDNNVNTLMPTIALQRIDIR